VGNENAGVKIIISWVYGMFLSNEYACKNVRGRGVVKKI